MLFSTCPECKGAGRVLVGRCGPNDPDCRWAECEECGGTGEVEIAGPEEDEE